APRAGALREVRDDVRPLELGTDAIARDRLDAVANHRAAVDRHRAFDDALVVVDEQARRHEVAHALLHAVELDRARDGVGRAAAQVALVVDGRAFGPKIDASG